MIIAFFFGTLAGIAASEGGTWSDWMDILGDTFEDTDYTSGDSFTDMLWDQVDFGDATASTSTTLLDGWLTGVEFNDYLDGMTTTMRDLLDTAGDTEGMDTSEIVDAITDAGFDPEAYGWESDTDLQDVLDQLNTMVVDMEVLSFEEGMDLSSFTSLSDMEDVLTEYGYSDLYTLTEINDYLEDTVGMDIPDSYSDYQDQLDTIEAELTDIISGESDAPEMEDVLSEMESLINDLQTEVDGGATELTDAVTDLTTAYEALSEFNEDPTDMILDFSEDLVSIFTETNFDYDDLDAELGEDWLSNFVSAMQEIDEDTVCEDDFVKETIRAEYSNYPAFASACWKLIALTTPTCDCLNGAGIYGDADKEDVMDSLNCLYAEGDDLTVEDTLRECNGEDIEDDDVTDIEDAFETLEDLTDLLTEDNYGDSLSLDIDTDELSDELQSIIDAIEDLSDVEIDPDATDEEYLDSVSTWIEKFNTLVNDLDLDGTYADQGQALSDLVDSAYSTLQSGLDSGNGEDASSGIKNEIKPWVWVVVAIAAVGIFSGIYCIYVAQKNRQLAKRVSGIMDEGLVGDFRPVPNEGDFLPVASNEPVRTAVTIGESDV